MDVFLCSETTVPSVKKIFKNLLKTRRKIKQFLINQVNKKRFEVIIEDFPPSFIFPFMEKGSTPF